MEDNEMSGTYLLKRVGALVVALAALIALPTYAAPAGAQLVTVQTGGNLTSGGTLSYQLNLTVTSPGAVVAKATVKGKHWKASFPVLSNSLAVGFDTVSSAQIAIPSNFHTTAVLRVTAKFNKRNIGSKAILISIAAPSTTPAVPQTTWYDVGYGSNVVVNADAVSTNDMTPPIAYAWSITDTDVRTNATFSSTTTNAPKFTTLPLTRFTNTLEVTSGGTTNVLNPIDLDNTFDLASNSNLVGITTEQMTKSTYDLQVIVSDTESHSATGNVTVISTSVSPGQPSIPIGERQYLTAAPNGTNASTYSWSVTAKPTGSAAVLENSKTRTPSLRPDKEGDYVLQLTVAGGGQTNSSFVTVHGATYVGVATCASCHGTNPQVGLSDYYTPWSQTLHATMAQRGVDGLLGSFYNESCFACHTLGNNPAPLAVNGGFDDVQKTLGWKFPTVLQVGNYASMPTNLQNLANIQCENCHGPGSQHPGAESANLDVAVCATCHQDGDFHNRPKQWSLGPHGADDGYLSVSIGEAPNASCSKCHSPASFVDNLKGKALTRLEAGRLTCQACHDPHNVAMFPVEAHQVRIYDTVTLDDSVAATPPTLTGEGPSATCMFCHNARRSPPPTYSSATTIPHESTATDVLFGLRACTNVQAIVAPGVTNTIASVTLENSAHAGVAKCVDCHMFPDSNPNFTGSNTVGDHTFSMTDRLTGEDNLAACNQCHAGVDPVSDFDHMSVIASTLPHGGDYDGDGTANGVQTEVTGLLTNLVNKMLATGMTIGSGGTHWTSYTNSAAFPVIYAAQRNAAWNEFLIERELSAGVHNTAFTVRLLQWTYTVLSTNTGGLSFQAQYPNADLR
jgi:hypothetical protein